jgi:hypothetical protein
VFGSTADAGKIESCSHGTIGGDGMVSVCGIDAVPGALLG